IQVFKRTGEPLFAVGKSGEGNGTFTVPMGIDVDDDGNIYVVDMLNRVQKFDRTGAFNLSWGVYGGLAGQLAEPSDVCFHEGRIYVADRVNHRLQVFTTDGHFVLQWGRHPETHHAGRGRTHYPSTIKISQDGRYAAIL